MSITFWAPDAPRSVVDTFECFCEGNPECFDCKGTGKVEFEDSEGEFNVANTNGWAIQQWLGFPEPDYGGSIPVADLPELKGKLESLQSDPERLNSSIVAHWGAAAYGLPGRERIVNYLRCMVELVNVAIKHNCPLCWG